MNKDAELRKQIGARIRNIRNELNMTKGGLAKVLGVTGQFLGVVESGRSNISYDKLRKLCEVSGYSADYILFGKNTEAISQTKGELEGFSNEQIQDACEVIKKLAIYLKNEK